MRWDRLSFLWHSIIYNKMTGYYVLNNGCVLSRNEGWGSTDLEGYRKALYTELFFIFFLYFITQALHTFRYKNSQTDPNSIRQSLAGNRISILKPSVSEQGGTEQTDEKKEDPRPDLPWHQKRWNRNFSFIFSSHSVALGMVILFSPLTGAIVVAYIHLLLFFVFTVAEFKLKITIAKVCRTLMDLSNLSLIIIGTVGINYAQSNKDGCLVDQR